MDKIDFNKISNKNINNMEDYLKNLAKQKKSKTKQTEQIEEYYSYDIQNCIKTDIHNISIEDNTHINFCIFRIIESTKYKPIKYPYLQYLLYKYPTSKKKESDLCVFPFVTYTNNDNIKNIGKKFMKKIFNKQYNCLGYIIKNNEVYLFYNIDFNLSQKGWGGDKFLIKRNMKFWWCILDEICNKKQLLNFPIHYSVSEIFLKHPCLIYLKNKQKEDLELPITTYIGEYLDIIPFFAIIGLKTSINSMWGPYYLFNNYSESFRNACWSQNYKHRKIKNKKITDEDGKYKKGGIIRYALFLGKSRTILELLNDNYYKDVIFNKTKLIPKSHEKKLSGKWSKKYDSLFLNNLLKNKNDYFNLNPIILSKNLLNFSAMSIHEVDMSSTKTNWDPLYEGYKIL